MLIYEIYIYVQIYIEIIIQAIIYWTNTKLIIEINIDDIRLILYLLK